MYKTVSQLITCLVKYSGDLEIVTEPSDHTYWKGIDVGKMTVEVGESGEYCDTSADKGDNIKEVVFIGVG